MTAERSDFGARLRAAREARGLSVKHVATSIKISALVLEALERNDVSRLPGGLFSRALVRAYAREVGLDAERTVREFTEQFAPPDESADEGQRPRARRDLDEASGHFGLRWLGLGITLLLVVVWVGIERYYGNGAQTVAKPPATAGAARGPATPAPARPSAPAEPTPAAGNVAAQPESPQQPALSGPPDAAPSGGQAPGAATPQPQPGGEERAGAVIPAPPAGAPQPASGAATPAQGASPVAADPSLPLQLVLSPTSPCWISARVEGSQVVGRVVQPGEKVQVSAAKSIVLTAGDAAALSYTVNNEPGRSLGGAGQVVTVVITTGNFRTFTAGRQ